MKKFLTLVIVLTVGVLTAQQMPQYSQYLRNQYMINPGAAGVYDFTDVTIAGRMQWVGFDNAPMTTYASVTAPLSSKPKERYNPSLRNSGGPIKNPEINTGKIKHAVGGQLIGDQFGAFRKIQFAGTYAIHLPITKSYNLSFGTKIGISNNSFLQDRAVVANPSSDATYGSFVANQASQNFLNIGAGFYFYSDKLFLGVSADQLTRNMVSFGSGSANFNPTIHTNITGGIKLNVSDNFTLTPAFLVKYMYPAPPSIEGSIQAEYMEWLWMGVSYRHKDAIVAMAGLNITNKFKFGYSFDYSLSKFNNFTSGGHELVLGIMLGR
jgi:type IX secretion system PorP/SprF family membrane protein